MPRKSFPRHAVFGVVESVSQKVGDVAEGTKLQIHFDAASGWSFGGWKSGHADPDITVTLDEDTEVEAIVL